MGSVFSCIGSFIASSLGSILTMGLFNGCNGSENDSKAVKSKKTRLKYFVILIIFAATSWILYSHPKIIANFLLKFINQLDQCSDEECVRQVITYRLHMALVAFHLALCIASISTKTVEDIGGLLHNEFWILKSLTLVGLCVASYFIPPVFFKTYSYLVFFQGALFLLIQLIVIVDFSYNLQEFCIEKYELTGSKIYSSLLIGLSGFFMLATIVVHVLLLAFRSSMQFQLRPIIASIAFISIAAVLTFCPKIRQYNVKAGLLQLSIVSFYSTGLLASLELSRLEIFHPANLSPKLLSMAKIFNIFNFVFVTFYMTRSTKLYTKSEEDTSDQPEETVNNNEQNEDIDPLLKKTDLILHREKEIDYSYWKFHLVLILSIMYMSCILTNWSVLKSHDEHVSASISVLNYVVQEISVWVVNLLYIWVLVVPAILNDRIF